MIVYLSYLGGSQTHMGFFCGRRQEFTPTDITQRFIFNIEWRAMPVLASYSIQRSIKMKRLLNVLYVTTQNAWLIRDGQNVVIRVEHENKMRFPIHTLNGIVCFGLVSCTPQLMQLCAENDVLISFLSEHGKFYARVHGRAHGNVLLRREQYRRADRDTDAADIARRIITAKIMNCRTVLMRARRDHKEQCDIPSMNRAIQQLDGIINQLDRVAPLDVLRGKEGEASRIYFSVFDNLILMQKDQFKFTQRSRRPPLDKINALLSFVYTMLANEVVSALESIGLDPAVGFLHRDRPGRPGLALDIMEEFRPAVADRLVLSLVNRNQIQGKQFKTTETGAVVMTDEARKDLIVAWQKRKQEEVVHPYLNEKLPLGMMPYVQALLMSRFLRGDVDAYPPYIQK